MCAMDARESDCQSGDIASSSGRQELSDESAARFRELCRRMRMADYAAAAWEEWHVNPMRIFSACMGSVVACYSIMLVTFVPGCSLDSWYPLAFVLGYGVLQPMQWGFYWRRGPRHAGTPAHYTGFVLLMLCIFALVIPAIAGPLALVPFNNRLLTTVLLSIAIWLFIFGGYTGASAPDKPPMPYTSFSGPLLKTTWTAIRVMDPVTDMILVRVLLELAEHPCYWFGQDSPCWHYRLLAALTGFFTGLYLLASIFIGIIEGYAHRPEFRHRMIIRGAFVLVHTTAFSCEAALVAVTLLKLMTEARDPRFDGGDPVAGRQYRLNIGVTVLSFAFTVIAFLGTVAGLGAALASVRRAAQRLSRRIIQLTPRQSAAALRDLDRPEGEISGVAQPLPGGLAAVQPTRGHGSGGTAAVGHVEQMGSAVVPMENGAVDSGVLVSPLYMAGFRGPAGRGTRVAPLDTTAPGHEPVPPMDQPGRGGGYMGSGTVYVECPKAEHASE